MSKTMCKSDNLEKGDNVKYICKKCGARAKKGKAPL